MRCLYCRDPIELPEYGEDAICYCGARFSLKEDHGWFKSGDNAYTAEIYTPVEKEKDGTKA